MGVRVLDSREAGTAVRPSVSIVFLVHNRREELRESLRRMLSDSRYDRERVDVIVVDNASTDGSRAMVAEDFPDAQLIVREENAGVSGWNDGFSAARGDGKTTTLVNTAIVFAQMGIRVLIIDGDLRRPQV